MLNPKSNLVLRILIATATIFVISSSVFARDEEPPASGDLIVKAWGAHGKRDVEKTFEYTRKLIDLYKADADRQQASLTAFPRGQDEINAVEELNNVATAYFIQAESHMRQQEIEEAKKIFKLIIDKYPFSQ
ncbi:tetratricopeptide repeat protein, partial [Candidatus Omnitrophota bacterium]